MPWGLPSFGSGMALGGVIGGTLMTPKGGALGTIIGSGIGYLLLDVPNHHQRGEEFKRDVMRALDEGYNPLD
jgi:hypothetical protein